jgi:hypothetical protein
MLHFLSNFIGYIKYKICRKAFRPKRSFMKSVPGRKTSNGEKVDVRDPRHLGKGNYNIFQSFNNRICKK